MTNADKFLDMYKQLEEVVRVTYGLRDSDSISYFLTKQNKYKDNKEAIKYCQDVRNILSHKKKIDKNSITHAVLIRNLQKFQFAIVEDIQFQSSNY